MLATADKAIPRINQQFRKELVSGFSASMVTNISRKVGWDETMNCIWFGEFPDDQPTDAGNYVFNCGIVIPVIRLRLN